MLASYCVPILAATFSPKTGLRRSKLRLISSPSSVSIVQRANPFMTVFSSSKEKSSYRNSISLTCR